MRCPRISRMDTKFIDFVKKEKYYIMLGKKYIREISVICG